MLDLHENCIARIQALEAQLKEAQQTDTLSVRDAEESLALVRAPITEKMIDMTEIVCYARREANFAGTWFSCSLPKGHKGEHLIRPEWETNAALRFVIGAGYFKADDTLSELRTKIELHEADAPEGNDECCLCGVVVGIHYDTEGGFVMCKKHGDLIIDSAEAKIKGAGNPK